MIDRASRLPITRQCQMLDLSRSSVYYQLKPIPEEDLALMRRIDEIHLKRPFFGSRKIRDCLQREGYNLNRKKVQPLMQLMGISALYPKKRRTSLPEKGHKIYPYLLRDLPVVRPNQVWAADICYVPMARGFLYLVGHHGLVQPQGALLAAFEYPGHHLLCRGFGGGLAPLWSP
jgi:putative transposase